MKRIGIIKLVTQPWKVDSTIYIDVLYVTICIFVSLIHQEYDPQDFIAKALMLVELVFVTLKTFKNLRIYD